MKRSASKLEYREGRLLTTAMGRDVTWVPLHPDNFREGRAAGQYPSITPETFFNHIAAGSFAGTLRWGQMSAAQRKAEGGSGNSGWHFLTGDDGRLVQQCSLLDTAYSNGIEFDQWDDMKPIPRIVDDNYRSGILDINSYSISFENEGHNFNLDTTAAQWAALVDIMVSAIIWRNEYYWADYDSKEPYGFGLDLQPYGPFDAILGHSQVDPTKRPDCPMPNWKGSTTQIHLITDINDELMEYYGPQTEEPVKGYTKEEMYAEIAKWKARLQEVAQWQVDDAVGAEMRAVRVEEWLHG